MVSERDREDIRTLYFVHRFILSSIAKLYGLTPTTIKHIVSKSKDVSIISDTECLLCGLPDVFSFYIDGNSKNKKPQNILMLCEADKRRLTHLQLRKRKGVLTSQF
jgi:hypothetical protein